MSKPEEQLDRAEAAFVAGDFTRLRAELDALPAEARGTPRARQLASATTFDPLHAALLVLGTVGLTAVALYYL